MPSRSDAHAVVEHPRPVVVVPTALQLIADRGRPARIGAGMHRLGPRTARSGHHRDRGGSAGGRRREDAVQPELAAANARCRELHRRHVDRADFTNRTDLRRHARRRARRTTRAGDVDDGFASVSGRAPRLRRSDLVAAVNVVALTRSRSTLPVLRRGRGRDDVSSGEADPVSRISVTTRSIVCMAGPV